VAVTDYDAAEMRWDWRGPVVATADARVLAAGERAAVRAGQDAAGGTDDRDGRRGEGRKGRRYL
jgi:hypothetical protein